MVNRRKRRRQGKLIYRERSSTFEGIQRSAASLYRAGSGEQRWKSLELSLGERFRQKNPRPRSLYASGTNFSLERATASTESIPSSGALTTLANVGEGG